MDGIGCNGNLMGNAIGVIELWISSTGGLIHDMGIKFLNALNGWLLLLDEFVNSWPLYMDYLYKLGDLLSYTIIKTYLSFFFMFCSF